MNTVLVLDFIAVFISGLAVGISVCTVMTEMRTSKILKERRNL